MIRGTTPTHIFNIPFDSSLIKELLITYSQRRMPIVEKTLEDCVLNGNSLAVTLRQRDTLKFADRKPVELQIRVLTTSYTALAGKITQVDVGRILDNDVLGSDPNRLPSAIFDDVELANNYTCSFDVDFGELYIVETGAQLPEGYEGEYEGAFTFTPMVSVAQAIPTARKYLRENIVLEPIPYAEVGNTSNGITVTIGDGLV